MIDKRVNASVRVINFCDRHVWERVKQSKKKKKWKKHAILAAAVQLYLKVHLMSVWKMWKEVWERNALFFSIGLRSTPSRAFSPNSSWITHTDTNFTIFFSTASDRTFRSKAYRIYTTGVACLWICICNNWNDILISWSTVQESAKVKDAASSELRETSKIIINPKTRISQRIICEMYTCQHLRVLIWPWIRTFYASGCCFHTAVFTLRWFSFIWNCWFSNKRWLNSYWRKLISKSDLIKKQLQVENDNLSLEMGGYLKKSQHPFCQNHILCSKANTNSLSP